MLYGTKNYGLAIKDIDAKSGIVSGYFASFDSLDSDGDIIRRGAFAKSIAENGPQSGHPRIKHLLDHSTTKAVGTLQVLNEDATGLYYESKAGRHQMGRDFLMMCEDGLITEHSVGFKTIKQEKTAAGNVMSELKLWEGSSLQCWGANKNTPLVGVKNLTGEEAAEIAADASARLSKLTKALKGAYSDDLCELLEIEAAQIDSLLKSLTGSKPAVATSDTDEPMGQKLADLFNSVLS